MSDSTDRKTNYERVYVTIKDWIIHGQLAPGERLKETNLAAKLDTSRTPVREALRKLEKDGMVAFYPSQGATVTNLDPDALRQLFECRAVLEGLAACGSALRITERELSILEENMILAEQFHSMGDNQKVVEKNTRFHDLILKTCANPTLSQMMEQIRTQILRYRTFVSSFGLRSDFSEEHRNIFSALKAKDAENAERFMRQHILNDMDAVLAHYDK